MEEYICRKFAHEYPSVHGNFFEVVEYDELEKIVRCRDCVHYHPENNAIGEPSKCDGVFAFVKPDPDGFCKWGKENNKEYENGA